MASGDCKQKHKKTLHLDRVQPLERDQRLHPEDLIRCMLPALTTPGGRVVIGGQVERNDLASNRSKCMELKIKKEKEKNKKYSQESSLFYFSLSCLKGTNKQFVVDRSGEFGQAVGNRECSLSGGMQANESRDRPCL